MRMTAVGVSCLLASALAGEFVVSQGAHSGYAYWSGWSGRSLGVFIEPGFRSGYWGAGLNLSVTTEAVKKDGQSEAFMPVGVLFKGRLSVLEAGLGLGYVPGFTAHNGRVSGGTPTFAWMLGASFPAVEWDRYALRIGLQNTGLTALDRFLNPALKLTLDYRSDGGRREQGER